MKVLEDQEFTGNDLKMIDNQTGIEPVLDGSVLN